MGDEAMKMKRKGKSIAIILVIFLTAFVLSCGGGQVSSGGTSNVTIAITGLRTAALSASSIQNGVASIDIIISAPDIETLISRTVPVVGNDAITENFIIPNGANRYFLAIARALDHTVLYQGHASSDLDGTAKHIDILMGVDISGEWTLTTISQGGRPDIGIVTFAQTGNSLSGAITFSQGNASGSGTSIGNDVQMTIIGSSCGNALNASFLGTIFADGSLGGTFTQTGGCGNDSGTWRAVRGHIVPNVTLRSIAVTPATPSITAGAALQFTATGGYSDGSSHDITTQVTWSSSNTSVATINSSGLATGVAAGTATITAGLSGISGSATLTVSAGGGGTTPTLSSISVTPANPSITVGATRQFTATGEYSDGSSHDITTQVTWSSSNTSFATVNNSGLATGVAAGTVTISASLGGISGNTNLTTTPPTPALPVGFPSNVPTGNYSIAVQVCVQGTCVSGGSSTLTNTDISLFAQQLINALNAAAAQEQTSCSQSGVTCTFNVTYSAWNGTSFTITDTITVTSGGVTESALITITVTKI
jgi:uncharacterized protein YjdB